MNPDGLSSQSSEYTNEIGKYTGPQWQKSGGERQNSRKPLGIFYPATQGAVGYFSSIEAFRRSR